jgi:hypothetical protein
MSGRRSPRRAPCATRCEAQAGRSRRTCSLATCSRTRWRWPVMALALSHTGRVRPLRCGGPGARRQSAEGTPLRRAAGSASALVTQAPLIRPRAPEHRRRRRACRSSNCGTRSHTACRSLAGEMALRRAEPFERVGAGVAASRAVAPGGLHRHALQKRRPFVRHGARRAQRHAAQQLQVALSQLQPREALRVCVGDGGRSALAAAAPTCRTAFA